MFKSLNKSGKTDFLEILNTANSKGTCYTFFANMDNNLLSIYSDLVYGNS